MIDKCSRIYAVQWFTNTARSITLPTPGNLPGWSAIRQGIDPICSLAAVKWAAYIAPRSRYLLDEQLGKQKCIIKSIKSFIILYLYT